MIWRAIQLLCIFIGRPSQHQPARKPKLCAGKLIIATGGIEGLYHVIGNRNKSFRGVYDQNIKQLAFIICQRNQLSVVRRIKPICCGQLNFPVFF